MPKAKPMYFSGSMPTWRSTFGCTMPQPAISSQRPLSAPLEGDVDLGGRLGEREERGAEAHLQVVAFEEAAQEVGDHALQVGEADVRADPQAFDLVEHRRMRGVGIDAIDAPGAMMRISGIVSRCLYDHVLLHVAHLDRAGMRTQQDAFGNLAAFILAGRRCRASNAPGGRRACSAR